MNVMMQAEYGFGSETYDFVEYFVIADPSTGKIERRVRFGKLRALCGWIEGVAYYGFSYDAERRVHEDFTNGVITIPIQKVKRRWGFK